MLWLIEQIGKLNRVTPNVSNIVDTHYAPPSLIRFTICHVASASAPA